ncbi:MAG TPA: AAA family ATPase [Trebonia sp.]|jgi:predicted ATPase|nr:AAA family ATPase [Trebonia sp.]
MPAYILTGAPGAGKTAVLRLLETLGYAVVEEAATDVIALGQAQGCDEPWRESRFIDKVIALQRRRQGAARAAAGRATVFFDRSPACTLALSRYLALPESPLVARGIARLLADGAYEATAFFIRNQGFIRATEARRISFQDSLSFEQLHEQAYRDLGFQLIDVPAGPLADRVALILQAVTRSGC